MSQYCALAECDEEIEQPEKGPLRKFCCPAHRTAARAARLRAEAVAAAQDRTAEHARTRLRLSVEEALDARDARHDAELEVEFGPGPLEPPEPVPGPHRHADPAVPRRTFPARAAENLPDTSQEAELVPALAAARPGRTRTPVRLGEPRRPRLPRPRTVMAAGLIMAMTFGGGSVLFNGAPGTTDPTVLAERPTLPPAGLAWQQTARVALASIDRQLEVATAAENRWNALPPERRENAVPGEVRKLLARKATLARQRAVLASQLSTWDGLAQSETALRAAENQRAALRSVAPSPRATAPATASVNAVVDQEKVLDGQIAVLRQQNERYRRDVDSVVAAPVPDSTDATSPLSRAVTDLSENPVRPRPVEPSTGNAAVLALPSDRTPNRGDRPRLDTGTSAPPPDRDGDGLPAGSTLGPASTPDRVLTDPIDTSDDLVPPLRPVTGALRNGDSRRPPERAPGSTDRGPVDSTTDAVGGAVDAVTGRAGAPDQDSGTSRRGPDRRQDDRGGGRASGERPVLSAATSALTGSDDRGGGRASGERPVLSAATSALTGSDDTDRTPRSGDGSDRDGRSKTDARQDQGGRGDRTEGDAPDSDKGARGRDTSSAASGEVRATTGRVGRLLETAARSAGQTNSGKVREYVGAVVEKAGEARRTAEGSGDRKSGGGGDRKSESTKSSGKADELRERSRQIREYAQSKTGELREKAGDRSGSDDSKSKRPSSNGKSDGGKSDGGKSGEGKSDGGKSDGGKSDGGKSDGGKSDGGKSDGGKSDGGKSDGGKSDGGKSSD